MFQTIVLIVFGVIVYLIWKRTITRFNQFKNVHRPQGPRQNHEISELIQDPVCKLYIAKEGAIFYKGRYFCSEKCKNEFKG